MEPVSSGHHRCGSIHVRQCVNQHVCGDRHYGRRHRLLGAGVREADRVLGQRVADVDSDGRISRGGHAVQPVLSFTATGTQTAGIPSTGSFTSLNYYAVGCSRGNDVRGATRMGILEVTGAPTITLATGSLSSGGTTSLTGWSGSLLPAASISATFVPNPAFASVLCQSRRFHSAGLDRRFHQYRLA